MCYCIFALHFKGIMRTKSLKKNKINVVTLGCSKNVYDSEVLMGQLRANNKEVAHEEEALYSM